MIVKLMLDEKKIVKRTSNAIFLRIDDNEVGMNTQTDTGLSLAVVKCNVAASFMSLEFPATFIGTVRVNRRGRLILKKQPD